MAQNLDLPKYQNNLVTLRLIDLPAIKLIRLVQSNEETNSSGLSACLFRPG
jgi:hypothetical protein